MPSDRDLASRIAAHLAADSEAPRRERCEDLLREARKRIERLERDRYWFERNLSEQVKARIEEAQMLEEAWNAALESLALACGDEGTMNAAQLRALKRPL